MKNLDIQYLQQEEMENINGGMDPFTAVAVGLAIAAGTAIINDWDDFKDGFGSAFD